MTSLPADSRLTDLVLEGGGVKGVALAGAVQRLAEDGYAVARVAGTSAGAVVGAVVAALAQRGEPLDRLGDVAATLDYRKVRDRGLGGRLLGPFAFLGDALSLLVHEGAYRGHYLQGWLEGVLGDLGVRTFGDLRLEDPGGDGTVRTRHRLVVVTSDVSRHRLVQLPWDYPAYGLDPDEQSISEAVAASAATPYLFRPRELSGPRGTSTLVDGALVSNYPITSFDRADGGRPRWPTIGVRLDALGLSMDQPARPVEDPLRLGLALVQTAVEGCQADHVLAPCNAERSIEVDTEGVDTFDFEITARQRDELLRCGRAATADFLQRWDFDSWLAHCRSPEVDR